MGIISGLLRVISGIIGLVFSLFGIVMLVFEVMVWIPDSTRASQTLGKIWHLYDPFAALVGTNSLPLFGAIVERKLNPVIWNPGITTILNWPSWIALLVLSISGLIIGGIFLSMAKGRRR